MKPTVLLVAAPGPERTLRVLALESQGWRVREADDTSALASSEPPLAAVVVELGALLEELAPESPGRRALEALHAPLLVTASPAEQERLVRQGLHAHFLPRPLPLGALVEAVRGVLPAQAQDFQGGHRPVLLVADDDPVSRKLLLLQLAPFHFEVLTASDGQTALELAQRRRPDAVLTDVLMPRMDGFRLCLALRKDPRMANVPVLLSHVGAPDELDLRMAQNVGANGFVRRGQEGDELLGTLLRELCHGGAVSLAVGDAGVSLDEHLHGMVRRLERQVGLLAQAERATRESEERYRLIVAGSYDGVWDWDLRRGTFWCSPSLLNMLGLAREASPTKYEVFVERLHPDDRDAVVSALSAHLERDVPYDVSFRLRHADGGYRACISRGRALRDAEDRPVRMAGIIGDVTEQLRLYRETQEAMRTRDEFLGVAAHELRTPLTALRLRLQGVTQALRGERPISPERLAQVVDAADRQVGRLASLVDTVLDVSQLQNQGPRLQLEEVDLATVIREAVDHAAHEASVMGCQLVLNELPSTPGRWDRARIAQVVRHLLANAMKFGPGKPVEVGLVVQPEAAVLQVTDHGIGIEPERVDGLFQRFERAVPSRHYGGLGLGLYRVRRIVEAHGGEVTVASVPGKGSTFRVQLPRGGPLQPGVPPAAQA
ncbi:MAG TPA: ATP-binding protein [Myxococcaceae bacterium]|nr:ATP-binding protein [Myxococcaceae bacterium]